MNARTALDEIAAYIDKSGCPYGQWYVGITSDVRQRLHGDHRVPKKNHWFIIRRLDAEHDARAVEKALLDAGCEGAPGGDDGEPRIVYAYLQTADTAP